MLLFLNTISNRIAIVYSELEVYAELVEVPKKANTFR